MKLSELNQKLVLAQKAAKLEKIVNKGYYDKEELNEIDEKRYTLIESEMKGQYKPYFDIECNQVVFISSFAQEKISLDEGEDKDPIGGATLLRPYEGTDEEIEECYQLISVEKPSTLLAPISTIVLVLCILIAIAQIIYMAINNSNALPVYGALPLLVALCGFLVFTIAHKK